MSVAVQLELGDLRPANNTVVLITGIGNELSPDGGDPLVCATQLTACCAAFAHRDGDWLYPNGTDVPNFATGNSFYRTRRDSETGGVLGAALLHRRFGAMMPTGIYSCVIAGADGTDQTLYVGLYTSTSNGKLTKTYSLLYYSCLILKFQTYIAILIKKN